jgi:hypothetical protein
VTQKCAYLKQEDIKGNAVVKKRGKQYRDANKRLLPKQVAGCAGGLVPRTDGEAEKDANAVGEAKARNGIDRRDFAQKEVSSND